jgi:glycosyltransferase involved in cell wall biosynthesis
LVVSLPGAPLCERRATAYILRSYPRLSQTFILNEILALEGIGVELLVFAMTTSSEQIRQRGVDLVRSPLHYLDKSASKSRAAIAREHVRALRRRPRRYLTTAAYVLRRRDLDRGYTTASRWSCFGAALRVVDEIDRTARAGGPLVTHVHSHFAHDPTLIALLVKRLTGLPFTFTAHARDIYQTPARVLAERIGESAGVITCCEANMAYLVDVAGRPARGKTRVIHHGIDRTVMPEPHPTAADATPVILSAGRLVEKKGFEDLLVACSLLKLRGVRFRCVIVGEGRLRDQIASVVTELGLVDDVVLTGARRQDQLLKEFGLATVFALTPIVTDDGDRDGIPNVILESLACGVPVVGTAAGGITEVLIHERTGLVAQPGDIVAIAAQLERLLGDPALRRKLATAGQRVVAEQFDAHTNALQIAEMLKPKELTT